MNLFNKRWLAGKVTRYHTWTPINKQSVGEHTYGVLQIVRAIYPEASIDLIYATVDHDVAELHTGDIPYHTKRYKDIGKQITEIEQGFHPSIQLEDVEFKILKWADMMELMLFCLYESHMGNQSMKVLARKAETLLKNMEKDFPDILVERVKKFREEISFETSYLLEPQSWTF